jgi:hypothetical protein
MLHKFTGENGDGSNPKALVWANGGLYGATNKGGAYGEGAASGGTVFQIAPPSSAGGAWTETVLYSFPVPLTGEVSGPFGGLLVRENGAVFGTTLEGTGTSCMDCGAVYELSPPASPGGTWSETVVYSFTGANGDGRAPAGLLYRDGALYGTTYYRGTADVGTIFELQPPSVAGGSWTETVLYEFTDDQEGIWPVIVWKFYERVEAARRRCVGRR